MIEKIKIDLNAILQRVIQRAREYWSDNTYIRFGRIGKDIQKMIGHHLKSPRVGEQCPLCGEVKGCTPNYMKPGFYNPFGKKNARHD